jgi:hypothetical protein
MKILTQLQLDKQYNQEAELLEKTKEWLGTQPDILVMRICDRYTKGYSDIFLCVDGLFVAIELKDIEGKPSPHQILFLKQVVAHHGIGGVCKTLREVIQYVEEARKRCRTLML